MRERRKKERGGEEGEKERHYYLNITRFILFLCVLLYSSRAVSTTPVKSLIDVTSSYNFSSYMYISTVIRIISSSFLSLLPPSPSSLLTASSFM